MENRNHFDFQELPNEIQKKILDLVLPVSMEEIHKTNKSLKQASNYPDYWQERIRQDFPHRYATVLQEHKSYVAAIQQEQQDVNQLYLHWNWHDHYQEIEEDECSTIPEPALKRAFSLLKQRDIEGLKKVVISLDMLDRCDKQGNSLLSLAQALDDEEIFDVLYKPVERYYRKDWDRFDIEKKDPYGRPMLYWAIQLHRPRPHVRELVQQDSNIEKTYSPLHKCLIHLAVEQGQLEIIQELLHYWPDSINEQDDHEQTPLLIAVKNNQVEIAKYLIDEDADVNAAISPLDHGEDGETPFYWAVRKGNLPLVKALFKKDWDLVWQDHLGEGPVIWAAKFGHRAIVAYLIKKGADYQSMTICPDPHDFNYENHGKTALFWAIQNGDLPLVKMLIGIDKGPLNRINHFGETPLILASKYNHADIVAYLLSEGADLNIRAHLPDQENHGKTALFWAIQNGNVEIIERLLKENLNAFPRYFFVGETPLTLAIKTGKTEVVNCFLRGLNKKDQLFQALELAITQGHLDIVTVLVNAGAPIQEYASFLFSLAAKHGHADIMRYILEHGGGPDRIRLQDIKYVDFIDSALKYGHINAIKVFYETYQTQLSKRTTLIAEWLQLAINMGPDKPEVVEYLLSKGASPSDQFTWGKHKGKTTLLQALMSGKYKMAIPLINAVDNVMDLQTQYNIDLAHFINDVIPVIPEDLCLELIKTFITKDRSLLECKDSFDDTPLLNAIRYKKYKIAEYFIRKGANGYGSPAATFKLVHKELALVKALIERDKSLLKLSDPDLHDETPLLFTLLSKSDTSLKIIEYLLKKGADPNAKFNSAHLKDQTPLQWAIMKHKYDIAALLLRHGGCATIPVQKIPTKGALPLIHYVTVYADLKTLKTFIDNNSELLEVKNEHGLTPLFIAVEKNKVEKINYLLIDKNANPNVICNHHCHPHYGKSPLQIAFERGKVHTVALLLRAGAEMTISDLPEEITSLVRNNQIGMLKTLYNHSQIASQWIMDHLETLLFTAVSTGKVDVIDYLLGIHPLHHDLILTKTDEQGLTPLFAAVEAGQTEVVGYLLKKGADPNVICQGKSMLYIAAEKGHDDVVKKLLKYGADLIESDQQEPDHNPYLPVPATLSFFFKPLANHVKPLVNVMVNSKDYDKNTKLVAAQEMANTFFRKKRHFKINYEGIDLKAKEEAKEQGRLGILNTGLKKT